MASAFYCRTVYCGAAQADYFQEIITRRFGLQVLEVRQGYKMMEIEFGAPKSKTAQQRVDDCRAHLGVLVENNSRQLLDAAIADGRIS